MDIEKIKELALANGFKLKEQASRNLDLNAYVYDFANAIEQEVKAQEHAKLKLLLCDEHLEKCESPTGIFNSQYPEEEPCLICLAKEAKAQAVPEWISTSERMPDEGEEVFVHYYGQISQATRDKKYSGGFKQRNCYGWEAVSSYISHWIPKSIELPEQYHFYYENDVKQKAMIEAGASQ
ncbi:DUF551 domain-containing protein [Acinetobacter variabilis]|uniref:DUF551 domain-containing protein n=1 Tax=Acinetobacter variabilis TaxID=70346 RepID=N9P1Q3_9GAMM|nr:DUF551 domain-containing protein [Acinetobacter variabilis]ENX08842.1 hypothetical protein F897_01993 [Acinetobacter variabilis]UBI30992.1 DUF551 domain-containing protein [Acinetobacter variabilis]